MLSFFSVRSAVVAVATALLVPLTWVGCGGESIELVDRPCPCVSGYTCCAASNTCVASGETCGGIDADASFDAGADAAADATSDASRPDAAPDAAPADAAPDGSPASSFPSAITPGIVQCGARPACEDPSPKCCGDNEADSGVCTGSDGVCSSPVVLDCDGPEDCDGGAVCCMAASGFYSTCSNVVDDEGRVCYGEDPTSTDAILACHDHTQCGANAPNCCPLYTGTSWPVLGFCSARAVTTTGPCDTP